MFSYCPHWVTPNTQKLHRVGHPLWPSSPLIPLWVHKTGARGSVYENWRFYNCSSAALSIFSGVTEEDSLWGGCQRYISRTIVEEEEVGGRITLASESITSPAGALSRQPCQVQINLQNKRTRITEKNCQLNKTHFYFPEQGEGTERGSCSVTLIGVITAWFPHSQVHVLSTHLKLAHPRLRRTQKGWLGGRRGWDSQTGERQSDRSGRWRGSIGRRKGVVSPFSLSPLKASNDPSGPLWLTVQGGR